MLAISGDTPCSRSTETRQPLLDYDRGPRRATMQTSPFNPDDDARILAAVIESSDDAIIAKNLDGIILSWNRGAERMYGYSAAEVIGRPISILIPGDQRHEFDEILARIR